MEVINVKNIDKEIDKFIESIEHLWKFDPLDGDQTKEISEKILKQLDIINANV